MRVWRAGELSLILQLRSCRMYMLKNTDYFIPPPRLLKRSSFAPEPCSPPL